MDSPATGVRRCGEDPGISRVSPFAVFKVHYDRLFIEFVFVQYEVQERTCLKDSLYVCMYFIVRQNSFKKNKGKVCSSRS